MLGDLRRDSLASAAGSGTPNQVTTNARACNYRKYGKVVQGSIFAQVTVAQGQWSGGVVVPFTNLPKSADGLVCGMAMVDSGGLVLVRVGTNGNLTFDTRYTALAINDIVFGFFSYIAV